MEARRHDIPGLVVTEREHEVPLDHSDPGGERLSVFTREIADVDATARPYLLYLQGGPGFEAPRPARKVSPPWLERALRDFRVLMLDQRGTGRSSAVGHDLAGTPEQQAERLSHFRADSIVADAELIRAELGVERWSVLGQSFGGFCTLSYMSLAPQGMREALFTGGLPPLGARIDEVYRATYERMRERSERYYARYPEDRLRVRALLERVRESPLRLPGGDVLHERRVRQLGEALGMGDGAERLHYLLELQPDSRAFLHDAERFASFPRNPIYAVLHEACWADTGATEWSAERVLAQLGDRGEDIFTGEHIFRWMFEDYAELAPLREAAEVLAHRSWPALYDRELLERNEVPAAAAIYAEDVYVERAFSEETAASVRGLRPWLTNEFEHDGLWADGERVLGRLLDLVRGRA